MWMPVLLLLLVGMVQVGKITYIYYTLKKAMYATATYVSSQQGVDFCDAGNPIVTDAKTLALTGSTDATAQSPINNLTPDMIQVDLECIDPASGDVGTCSTAGCGTASGGQRPDLIIVSIPNGYQVQLRFPYFQVDPISLKPEVRIPFGGT